MELSQIDIRKFTSQDLQGLVNLVRETINGSFPEVYQTEVIDFFLEYHSERELKRKAEKGSLLLAVQNKEIVASGYLIKKEIGGVYVRPDFQRQGIGKLLVEHLIQIAKDSNLNHIWLDSTLNAYEFYLKLGFQYKKKMVDYIEYNVPLSYFRLTMKLS